MASRLLADAFLDDPIFGWIVPDRTELAAVIGPIFEALTAAYGRYDQIHLVEPGGVLAGAAVWTPPGEPPVHPDDEELLVERLVAAAGDHLERLLQVDEAFAAAKPSEPAWYLHLLGVAPTSQGRGLGSALMPAVLATADASGVGAYLEASSPRNRTLYERHGFRWISDIDLPDGPTAYAMWREPRASG